jgi:hypothetical protein
MTSAIEGRGQTEAQYGRISRENKIPGNLIIKQEWLN